MEREIFLLLRWFLELKDKRPLAASIFLRWLARPESSLARIGSDVGASKSLVQHHLRKVQKEFAVVAGAMAITGGNNRS